MDDETTYENELVPFFFNFTSEENRIVSLLKYNI